MAQIKVKDISSIMMFTGMKANDNALALENRNYGYEDEMIGVLTKTSSNDSSFSNVNKEIFVETTPKYTDFKNLTELAYAYIVNKSVIKPIEEMYLNRNTNICFKYNYNTTLNGEIHTDNNVNLVQNDIKLYLTSINNAMYNKLKYYANTNELDYITYNGIKYNWNKPGAEINLTYVNEKLNIGNDYVNYQLLNHEVDKVEWDEATGSYNVVYEEIQDSITGETIKQPFKELQFSLDYIYRIEDVIKNQLHNIYERHETTYGDLSSYYLDKLNHKLSLVGLTYSFGKQTFNIYSNYDGEFNNWFNNKITVNVKDIDSLDNTKLADIVLAEDYYVNAAINENVRLCSSDKFNKDENIELISGAFNEQIDSFSVLSPYKIKSLDLTSITDKLNGEIDLLSEYEKSVDCDLFVKTDWVDEKESLLEELIIGKKNAAEVIESTNVNYVNCAINNIVGLDKMENLKTLNVGGCNNLKSLDLVALHNLSKLDATETSLSVCRPANGNIFDEMILPNTIESLILHNIKFTNNFDYTPNEVLTTLELDNVIGLDTHAFVKAWLTTLKDNNILNSGLVNYTKLKGVTWNGVTIETLTDLLGVELKEFTGNINIVGDKSDYITRSQYRLLHTLYGGDVFNQDNDLKFIYNLDENAFNIELLFEEKNIEMVKESEDSEIEIPVETYKEIGKVVINILDTVSGNSLLEDIQNIPHIYNRLTFNQFINNNKINIGISTKLDSIFDKNEKSDKLNMLNVGDVLLYVDKLVIVNKNTNNINMQFIKLGNISNIEGLSGIFNKLSSDKDYYISFRAMEEFHDDTLNEDVTPDDPENSESEIIE